MSVNPCFNGLSAFPITPFADQHIDFDALEAVFANLDASEVDSIGVLGSTGSYAYLNFEDRQRVIRFAGRQLTKPWLAGVTALNCSEVFKHCDAAAKAGARAVMVAAQSYVPLQRAEIERLFLSVAEHSPVPLCIYNNPVTTSVDLPIELLSSLAEHPNIQSIKYPAGAPEKALDVQAKLISALGNHAVAGYSMDGNAGYALLAGGGVWYSALAGVWPEPFVAITQAAQNGKRDEVDRLYAEIASVLRLAGQYGSLKVAYKLAVERDLAQGELAWPLEALN